MLKFVKSDNFRATVHVRLPGNDPQKPVEGSFTATYKHFDRSAFDAMLEEQLADAEFLDRVLVSVEGIGDDNGNALPANEQRVLVLNDLALGAAAVRCFVESLAGAGGKNSKPLRGR